MSREKNIEIVALFSFYWCVCKIIHFGCHLRNNWALESVIVLLFKYSQYVWKERLQTYMSPSICQVALSQHHPWKIVKYCYQNNHVKGKLAKLCAKTLAAFMNRCIRSLYPGGMSVFSEFWHEKLHTTDSGLFSTHIFLLFKGDNSHRVMICVFLFSCEIYSSYSYAHYLHVSFIAMNMMSPTKLNQNLVYYLGHIKVKQIENGETKDVYLLVLQLMIGGLGKIDLADWKLHTRLKHCASDSSIVKWFWRAIDSYDNEMRARVLQFVTGSSRVPLQGFKALQGACLDLAYSVHCFRWLNSDGNQGKIIME